ncbi:hypothetical protein SNE26_28935 [Mucilaginibacter sp. cycad4]|uniref:hypothetical protein n=1 Tax=Mucilaginibacter sp. cycad4 TaxID=3342096 RepID=UPI002AAA8669|nr:hypothetical protein [Mucilaginibacter gossypii]WPV00041.1 hypothetical protein SNE26_28935 [Mucilaginibacter gossypii]
MKIKTYSIKVFQVIADGVLSAPGIGEGRFIPSLIVNGIEDQELVDLISIHQETPPGDAIFLWTRPLWDRSKIILNVAFKKPMIIEFGIEFNLPTQNTLIDGIIQSRGFFLQVGREGDKPSTLFSDRILLEVPEMGFDKKWDEILIAIIRSKYKKLRYPKNDLTAATNKHIRSMRELWSIRRT